MNTHEALQIVSEVCRAVRGTLDDHVKLQAAIKAIADALPKASLVEVTNAPAEPKQESA